MCETNNNEDIDQDKQILLLMEKRKNESEALKKILKYLKEETPKKNK
jgi:hypothetical protein